MTENEFSWFTSSKRPVTPCMVSSAFFTIERGTSFTSAAALAANILDTLNLPINGLLISVFPFGVHNKNLVPVGVNVMDLAIIIASLSIPYVITFCAVERINLEDAASSIFITAYFLLFE